MTTAPASHSDRALAFCLEQIVLPTGRRLGESIANDPWVVDEMLAPVFARDESGMPRFPLAYLELPRGHWKTGCAAAIALEMVLLASVPTEVVIAAADRDQAAIVLAALDGYLARNPSLHGLVRVRGDERIVDGTGSSIRVIASDAPSAWGLGGLTRRFVVIADELTVWGVNGEALWEALISATGKTPDAQTLVLSNAGYNPGERCWQWRVRRSAEREPWAHLYSAPGIVASWVSDEWVGRMRTLMPPSAFARVILNQWSGGSGDFVSVEQWRRCVDESLRPSGGYVPHFRYVAGLDLGLVKDATALAVMHREDGRAVLDEIRVWQGTPTRPVEIAEVEAALVDAARRFRSLRLVCDPWQFQGSVQRLRARGLLVHPYSFGSASVQRLSASLFRAITTAQLRVFPDSDLEQEVLSLVVRETAGGWRIDHKSGGFSDRAVALALAVQDVLAERPAPFDPVAWNEAVRRALPISSDIDQRLGLAAGSFPGESISGDILRRPL